MTKTISLLMCFLVVACTEHRTIPTSARELKNHGQQDLLAPVLESEVLSGSIVKLSWENEDDGIGEYVIERNSGSGFDEIATVSASKSSYRDLSISGAGTFQYRVAGKNGSVISEYSNVVEENINDSFENTASSGPPSISDFNPKTGPAGTTVTVSGQNLLGVTELRCGGIAAVVSSKTETSLVFTVPAGSADGSSTASGQVQVTSPGGSASGPAYFFVVLPPPTITALSSSSGSVGSKITLTGTNMAPAGQSIAIQFGGVSAVSYGGNSGSMEVTIPAGAQSGNVTLTTPSGTATYSGSFTVLP